jgi:transcription antitermination protein NusB
MTRRSKAREAVFQVLYQDDLNPKASPTLGEQLLARRLRNEELLAFAHLLLSGVRRNRQELDARLNAAADNWSVRRMAATDRNALRIGAYELIYTDTPDTVAVNEAIELAKRYGTAQSAAFVNGILDRLMHGIARDGGDENAPPAEEPPPAEPAKAEPETLQQRAQRIKSRK